MPPILHVRLFQLGGRVVDVTTILVLIAIIIGAFILTRVIRFVLHRTLDPRGVAKGSTDALSRLVTYVMMITSFVVALQTAGIDLGAVVAATAVFAVGVGLALQGIALNFVSGIVLLIERSIKVGDVLEVNDHVVRVMDMGIRATRVRTLFEEDIILPNSVLVQQPIKNLTLHDSLIRITATVGVAYNSDIKKVRDVLERIAGSFDWEDKEYEPVVLIVDFAPSSVVFEMSAWSHDPWHHRKYRSDMREAILAAFAKERISIAFPQLDVHFDPKKLAA